MKAYIQKIQQKDEKSRKGILVGVLTLSMVLVCFVWISSLTHRFSNTGEVATKQAIRPFALFTDSVSNAFTSISASVGSISFKNTEEKKQIDLIPVEQTPNYQ